MYKKIIAALFIGISMQLYCMEQEEKTPVFKKPRTENTEKAQNLLNQVKESIELSHKLLGEVKILHAQISILTHENQKLGQRVVALEKQLGLDKKTVKRPLKLPTPPPSTPPVKLLDSYLNEK